jgi:hypothetical protein
LKNKNKQKNHKKKRKRKKKKAKERKKGNWAGPYTTHGCAAATPRRPGWCIGAPYKESYTKDSTTGATRAKQACTMQSEGWGHVTQPLLAHVALFVLWPMWLFPHKTFLIFFSKFIFFVF